MVDFIVPMALIISALLLYLLPAIVASMRGHRNANAIFALNLLLGWTFLGWVIAIIWSLTANVVGKSA